MKRITHDICKVVPLKYTIQDLSVWYVTDMSENLPHIYMGYMHKTPEIVTVLKKKTFSFCASKFLKGNEKL